MDTYEQLRNQVVWAVTHYGLVNTDGIIETLRETVLKLDTNQLQNTTSSSDYTKCGKCGGTGKYMYSINYIGVCDECDGKGHFVYSENAV